MIFTIKFYSLLFILTIFIAFFSEQIQNTGGDLLFIAIYVVVEEIVRLWAYLHLKEGEVSRFMMPIIIGILFGLAETTNAFFPQGYSSHEAQNAHIVVLVIFEFLFGFIVHYLLSIVLIYISRHFPIALGFSIAVLLHTTLNQLLS